MGRHRIHVGTFEHGYRGPGPGDPYRCEWAIVVGDRVRRLRRDRGLTLVELSRLIDKPGHGSYSPGYFSRLERGSSAPPLFAYLAIADALEVPQGRLLGPDDFQNDLTQAELTLIRLLRRSGLTVEEAILRVLGESRPAA